MKPLPLISSPLPAYCSTPAHYSGCVTGIDPSRILSWVRGGTKPFRQIGWVQKSLQSWGWVLRIQECYS